MAAISLLGTLAFVAAASAQNGPGKPLTFREDGTFRIAIFEDLHYGEGESRRICKQHTTEHEF